MCGKLQSHIVIMTLAIQSCDCPVYSCNCKLSIL